MIEMSNPRGCSKSFYIPVTREHASQLPVTSIASVSASVWLLPQATAFTPCPTSDCMTCETVNTQELVHLIKLGKMIVVGIGRESRDLGYVGYVVAASVVAHEVSDNGNGCA